MRATEDHDTSGIPAWLYWLLVLAVVLKVVGLLVFVVSLRRRRRGAPPLPVAVRALQDPLPFS